MRENRMRRLTRQGMETCYGSPYTGTKLETADTAKGMPMVTRHSLTLLGRGSWKRAARSRAGYLLHTKRGAGRKVVAAL